jgi:hypothetical protein
MGAPLCPPKSAAMPTQRFALYWPSAVQPVKSDLIPNVSEGARSAVSKVRPISLPVSSCRNEKPPNTCTFGVES